MRLLLAVLLVGCGATTVAPELAPDDDAEASAGPRVFGGSFKIENKRDEAACREFSQVAGDLVVEAPGLTRLDLRGVETVGEDVFISSNTALTELDLADLTAIRGGLFIWDNEALRDTPGLRNLREVGGALHVTNNASLQRLTLGAVRSVGAVRISGNAALDDLAGLTQVEAIQGDLIIEANAALTALPFAALKTVKGSIRIEDNPRLPTCLVQSLLEQLRAAGYAGRATTANNGGDAASCRGHVPPT